MIKNSLPDTTLTTHDFWYDLPVDRIAQIPAEPRDSSRLLVLHRDGSLEHRIFHDIRNYLRPEDVLVVNDSRVLPARIFGHRVRESSTGETGIEVLLLRQHSIDTWETLVRPGKKARPGAILTFGDGELTAEILETVEEGNRIVRFTYDSAVYESVYDALHHIGTMPLPPYITRKLEDPERYQTVYAREEGSAAAPTAGLHFTNELLAEIQAAGTAVVPVMLHVGLGTFRPVKADKITDHTMHAEYFSVSADAAAQINSRRAAGGRVIAVGTTSCRVLESAASDDGTLSPMSGDTGIFIYPGYHFKIVNSLITNFHLPESTLLMLVSALTGKDHIMQAYQTAVAANYRFFSFGDAMFIE